ncbi:MAG: VWA domain-containing protein [Terriglobales bacterium]
MPHFGLHHRFHSLCIATLLLALGAAGLSAQSLPQQGPVIIPKKKTAPASPVAPPPQPTGPPTVEKPQYHFSVNVPDVEVPVSVQLKDGQFVPHLTAKQFAIYEDGVRQQIEKVSISNDAPMTAVLLVQFNNTWYPVLYRILQASYDFTGLMQPQDWVALVTFDLKPYIVVDFTHDRGAIQSAIASLHFANFSESDLFDSLSNTIARLNGVQGHKTIILIATGLNTFSHMNFDQLRKQIETTQNVTIYSISMSFVLENWLEENGYTGESEMALLQGDNEMRYFATATGGRYYQPRFIGGFGDVFKDIAQTVRSQYVISYSPTDRKLDGTQRKIKVELLAPDGKPLQIVNQKGKKLKYTIDYRPYYTAPRVVQ